MPKAKTNSSDRVVCSCGCNNTVSRRTQTRHLRGDGPVMAVAEILETRAYFHKPERESPGSPPPKRPRLQTPVPEDTQPQGPLPPDICLPDPSPSPTPASSSKDPAISGAVRNALSAPWTGPGDFRYNDEDSFDSSDIDDELAQPVPIVGPTEPDSSDTDSEADLDADMDNDGFGSGRPDTEDSPDVFETDVNLNAAEYSE